MSLHTSWWSPSGAQHHSSQAHEPDLPVINIRQLKPRKILLSSWSVKETKETWQLIETQDHGLAPGSIKVVTGTVIKFWMGYFDQLMMLDPRSCPDYCLCTIVLQRYVFASRKYSLQYKGFIKKVSRNKLISSGKNQERKKKDKTQRRRLRSWASGIATHTLQLACWVTAFVWQSSHFGFNQCCTHD